MGALSGRADLGLAPQGLDKILRVRIRAADPEKELGLVKIHGLP